MKKLFDMIVEAIGEDFSGSVGLRADLSENLIEGETLPNSFYWEAGEMTDEELDGTSAIIVSGDWTYDSGKTIMKNLEKYASLVLEYGETIAIIAGDLGEGGEDIGEIVIPNAKVIKVIDKSMIK